MKKIRHSRLSGDVKGEMYTDLSGQHQCSANLWLFPQKTCDSSIIENRLDIMMTVLLAQQLVFDYSGLMRGCDDEAARAKVHASMEALMVNLMAYHTGLPVDRLDMQRISDMPTACSDYYFLESIQPNSVPVAVVRALLFRDRIDFDDEKVPHWLLFADTYGPYI